MSTSARDARTGAAYEIGGPAPEPLATVVPARCLNCDMVLGGPYCAHCGQRVQSPRPTFGEVATEVWDEFVSLDGRFLASLRLLLTRPGGLTLETLAGRRARYLAPLRLYLLCSLAYFVTVAALPDRALERRLRARASAVALTGVRLPESCRPARADEPAMIRAIRALDCKTDRDPIRFETARRANVPRLMFVLVPLFAAILALAVRGHTFPEHLYFALHFHSFAFVAMTFGALTTLLPWPPLGATLRASLVAAIVAYGCVALQRVHGGGWKRVAGRAAAIGLLYSCTFFVGMIGVLLLTASRM